MGLAENLFSMSSNHGRELSLLQPTGLLRVHSAMLILPMLGISTPSDFSLFAKP